MGGDHKCPVCGSTFTRSQHVARHMRSHTGDRPYKCVHCGDQFARSDLLSRHVNKCHSSEKKAPLSSNGANAANANATSSTLNGRRKPRQMSTSSQPASSTSYTHPNPNGIAIGATGDPFTNIYQPSPHTSQSPSHRYPSSDGIDPPSLSSSLASSSSASASLDSLPHEPVFHVPQQSHYQFGRPSATTAQWGLHSYPNYLPPLDGSSADGASMYKPNDHFTATSTTTVPQYHDLPTPLAYAGAQGPQPHPMGSMNPIDPFMSSQSMPPLSNGQLDTSLYNTSRAAPNLPRGEGGFSSAFGLMSLDDPSVLAGISNDGMPFFNGSAIPDLHGLLPTGMTPIGMPSTNANANPGANSSVNATTSNGAGTNGLYGNTSGTAPDVQTPNSKEQLKELWAAFLRDPTTGIKADGTEMGRPEFPIVSPGANANANSQPSPQQQQQTQPQPPQQQSQQQQPQQPPYLHLHRRSSSYSGTGANSISNFAKNGIKHESPPYNMPTAKYGGPNVVKKLEDQASRVSPDSATNATGAAPAVAHIGTAESLRSYEEAILSRKAPVLKLPNKLKGREGTGSGASSVLPSLSNAGRGGISMSGGGVTSLMSRDLATATAAGASSVPFGSTPFQQQLHSQQMAGVAYGDRPVISMPRPRSRHGTSSQNSSRPGTSSGPPSAAAGGPGAANAGPNSQPGSRPGTASSQGQGQSQSQSPPSVPLYQSHSTPNSRPSTSNGPSPYVFAYNPPPLVAQPGYPNYGLSPTSMKTGGQGIPPEPSPSPTTAQQLVSAVSSTSDLGSVVTNRPTYKRLASSALEPSSTKRPHLRRGDTNFNPNPENPNSSNPNLTTPYNDGNDGFESEGLSDVERSSVHSFGSERSWHGPHTAHMGSMNRPWGGGNPGQGHHSASPFNGQGGPGGYNAGMSSAQMRRMSEPAVAAPRMAMRAPPMPHQQHQMQQQAQMQVPIHPQMQMPVQMQAAQAGNGQ